MLLAIVLEKTLKSPLNCKEIQPVNLKGNQSWIFIGRTDPEAPVLWPPDVKSWPIWKDPDARKDWRWEEKETTEDEMVGWRHWLDGRESEWTPGVGDGRGGLACCDSWGCKESDTTERLNWTEGISGVIWGFTQSPSSPAPQMALTSNHPWFFTAKNVSSVGWGIAFF